MAEETESTLNIPGPKRAARIVSNITNEEFRFAAIKAQKSKPKWDVTNPEDPDDTVSTKVVEVVILIARPNFYLSKEDKEKGKEAVEKRRLIVLRTDEMLPEQLYVSHSALRNWKSYCKALLNGEDHFMTVLTAVHLEMNTYNGFTWPKPVFNKVRSLTDDEQTYINALAAVVDARVGEYEETGDLDAAEAALVNRGKKPASDDEEDERNVASKKANKSLKDDDEEEDPPAKPKKKKVVEEDEEEDPPAKSKGSQKKVEDEEDEDDDLQTLKNKKAAADKPAVSKPKPKPTDEEEED